ncbi:Tol-Pal system beta propeller repeat protein TolB [Sediminimonas sp.]|uniref:Tol-Pal system beta propeller repeat protein TolB n=1 Tax=Sediminimonas sp. TaxID=2823379 RepID=UPI0025F88F66|nr:Tol-Pal system beta propeller repeat protein TolB [Sediminimonas sp.]
MMRMILTLLAVLGLLAAPVAAQDGPLRIEITEGVIEPMPVAVPDFVVGDGAAREYASRIARVVADDLSGTGLFREIPREAFISPITSFSSPVQFADWKAINAQALVSGAVEIGQDGRLVVKFRLYDVFAGQELGEGLRFASAPEGWRRMAHKVADAVYTRITGEGPYFDSRVAFVAETGPKNARRKRLAVMDYDGANVRYLTGGDDIVLAPRFSPDGEKILFTSYSSGFPRIYLMDVASLDLRALEEQPGSMSFAPRFGPDGRTVVYSMTRGGTTDIYTLDIDSGTTRRLTRSPSIDTAPSFSPDGTRIVFESDRSGSQQLYIMSLDGGSPERISFGQGRYGTPVWSPRGDLIAFTKQSKGRFHIGVMRLDGSEERLLTASFLDEGPTWSPNGRVIMFTRESQGADGQASLYSVDITGRNLKRMRTETGASDPSWSPLLR